MDSGKIPGRIKTLFKKKNEDFTYLIVQRWNVIQYAKQKLVPHLPKTEIGRSCTTE